VIPEHLGRLMSPEDQKKYGFESIAACTERLEAQREKDDHDFLLAFLRKEELGYYHAPMYKKSELPVGIPDFGIYRGSRILWIEFKTGKNKLSPEQKNQIARMLTDGNEVRVCYSYPEALAAVKTFFGIN
jgi:hypothetical protein